MKFLLERQYKDDLRGQQFGELTVIEPDNSQPRHSKHWICKCSCGKTVSVERKHLLDNSTKSCGHGKRQSGLDHYEDNFKGMRDRQNKYNTNLEVIRNQKIQSNNTSGVKGVDYHKSRKMWRGRVSIGGKELTKWSKDKDVVVQWRKDAIEKYYKPKIDDAVKNGDLKESVEKINSNKATATLKDGTRFNIWTDYESNYGQTDCFKVAYVGNDWMDENDNVIRDNLLGYVEYCYDPDESPRVAYVKMIEVKDTMRRKGVGTALIQALQQDFGKDNISYGYSTPDGTSLLKSMGIMEALGDSKVFYVGKTEVLKNPTDNEYRRLYNEQKKLHPNQSPLLRQTYGEFGNYYVWPAFDSTHYNVELYIYKNFGERTNQSKNYDLFNHYYLDENLSNSGKLLSEQVLEDVIKYFGTSSTPEENEAMFILPDGNFMFTTISPDIEDEDDDYDIPMISQHDNVDEFLIQKGYASRTDREPWDETIFQSLYNVIRFQITDEYVRFLTLPSTAPNTAQYDSIEQVLDLASSWVGEIEINSGENKNSKIYSFDEYTVDDIIKRIKRYYSSGTLYEDFNK